MIKLCNWQRIARDLVAVALLLGMSVAANAHTGLKTSIPANEAVVNVAPEQIHLTFTASVALVRFSVTASDNRQIEVEFKPGTEAKAEYHQPVPPLPAGNYKVDWAVIGADGHTVADSFTFTVDPTAAEAHAGHQEAAHAH